MAERSGKSDKNLEKLFSKVDDIYHVYTWEYTTQEKAISLYNIDEEFFALITERKEMTEDTALGSWDTSSTQFCAYLFLKSNPQQAKPIPDHPNKMPREDELKELRKKILYAKKESDLVSLIDWGTNTPRIEWGTNTPSIRKVEEIYLETGRVYISEGDLLFDRVKNK